MVGEDENVVPRVMTEQERSRRIAHARKVWNADRRAMEPFQQADLTPQEKADLDRAWRTSILRYSSTSYRPRLIKLALGIVAFSAVLLSFAVLPAVAYLADFPKQ